MVLFPCLIFVTMVDATVFKQQDKLLFTCTYVHDHLYVRFETVDMFSVLG